MSEPSPLTQKLIKELTRFEKDLLSEKKEGSVEVEKISLLKTSFFREVIKKNNWQNNHFLRRTAIEKLLRKKAAKDSARAIIKELITSGILENKTIKKSAIDEVQKILDKRESPPNRYNTLITACEIENILSPLGKREILISYAFNSLKRRIKIEGDATEEEKNILLYAAILRTIFELDDTFIFYYLTKKINKEKKNINGLNSPPFKKLCSFLSTRKTAYFVINDILIKKKSDVKIIFDIEKTEKVIREFYKERVDRFLVKQYRRIAVYTIFVILTGFFLTPLINPAFPFNIFLALFPATLTALLVFAAPPPPRKNEKRTVLEIIKLLYKKEKESPYLIKPLVKRRAIAHFLVNFFYATFFLVVVSFLFWVINNFIGLSFSASLAFVALFSLVSFLAVRINENMRELYIIEIRENFPILIADILSFPLTKISRIIYNRTEENKKFSNALAFLSSPCTILASVRKNLVLELKRKKESIY